jgi:hypothetical protein
MLAVAVRPFCGMISSLLMPVGLEASVFRQICHPVVAVRVALKVNPLEVTLHPEKLGGAERVMQIGSPQLLGDAGTVKLAVDEVHDAVAVPTLNDTLDDVAVAAPVGVAQGEADAMWAPRPSTAAIAGATR